MKRNKDRIFRFPFDIDPRVFIILTAVFFVFALKPVQRFLKGTYNIETVRKKIENQLNRHVESAKKQLTAPVIRDLSMKGFNSDYAAFALDLPYTVCIYENDSLTFWNSNTIFPRLQSNNTVFGLQHHEGSFVQVELPHSVSTKIKVFLLLPIKEDLHNSNNRIYFHALGQENDFGFDIQTSYAEGSLPIRVENETPYYLIRKSSPLTLNDPFGWQLFLSALPFIFMGISIHTYFKVIIQDKKRHRMFLWVLLTAIGLRALNLWSGLPNNFSEFKVFDPHVFYHDIANRSLGDTFINFCLGFWILLFYLMNVQGTENDFRFFKRNKWAFVLKVILLGGLSLVQIHIIESVILKTDINFDTTLFSSIDIQSYIGILTFMVGMANILLACLIYTNRSSALRLPYWIKYGMVVIIYVVSIITLHHYFSANSIHFLFLLSVVILVLMDNKKMKIRFDFNSYEFILWIILFSLIITQYLIFTMEAKEKSNRILLAKKFASEIQLKDIAEPVFAIQETIKDEYDGSKLHLSDSTTLLRDIYYKYFRNIASQYDITMTPLGMNDSNLLRKKITGKVLKNNQGDSIFYTQQVQGTHLYFYFHPYREHEQGYIVSLYKNLNGISSAENDYHQNIKQGKEREYNYDIGVYRNSHLVASSGSQGIHSTISTNDLFKKDSIVFRDAGSKSELWFNDPAHQTTVLISKDYSVFSRFLTLFACLFFIYFSVVSLYILGNIIARSNLVKKRFINLLNINLRLRIHTAIILVILISFLSVGYFTSFYLISHYKTNSNNKAIEKMASVKTSLMQILQSKSDSTFSEQNIIDACEELSRENGYPMNLFSMTSGSLIHSSSRLLNDINFPTSFISPKAFHELKFNKLEYVSFHESKNDNDYYSTFSSFASPDNRSQVILQLPYQNSRIYFQQETFSVIVTLINTFVVVFLISSFIALLITNSVVQPFTYIVRQFTKINLSKTNEPLTWMYNDEIGLLVREYNRMLRKLENSSQLLARSEREMAWREMAKQVAHEIKNPLTPMKLSLQMLDKAIREDKPNIREMTERVTKTIIEQIETLTVIATNFSTFARMPENKNEVISLNEVLHAVTGMYNNDGINDFDFIIPSYDIHLFADKTQLIRVFTNIIQNAIQAIPENTKGMISLRVKKIKDNNVRISISDNGMGISKEKQAKLFQPYFTTKTSGTGLGLAMCKDIIEQLNGKITLESALDVGTSFFVDLPIYDIEKTASED